MKKNNIIVAFICLALFIIPFFWFRPGEADLGGDSSRLYFYDPLSYLKAQSLYGIISSGVGGENVGYYAIPFILILSLFKIFISSTQTLVSVYYGLTLSIAFLSCYLIVKDILLLSSKKQKYIELSSILAGLFYVFTPTLTLGWDKAILTHYQFFLNPLMFFLLFRFLTRNKFFYLLIALLVTILFPSNFTFVAAPPFFAFYPLAILFIILFVLFILKKTIPIKSIILGILLFLLLHLFHLGPQISNLLTGGSQINQNVFSAESMYSRGLSYFEGVAPSVKVSFSWLNLPQLHPLKPIYYGFIIFPTILLIGFALNRSRQFLLTGVFFLITFFFVTANITDVGFNVYKKLFDIPGFSMFRNFFGQWVFVFTFFYTLLLGQALYIIFTRLKSIYTYSISAIIVLILLTNAWPFINGSLVNKIHYQSKDVRIPSEIDPEYEKVLTYIRNLEVDGKFISFPVPDAGYQTITGKQGGAYQGPSTISYLTGKNDFTGYDGLIPFNETFLDLYRKNDIERIGRLFSILNIKYVFYNSDPAIYDNNFPLYPYTYSRESLPKNQKEYKKFLARLPIKKVKDFGEHYHIYEVKNYLPHIYTSNDLIYASNALTPYFTLHADESPRAVVFTDILPVTQDTQVVVEAENVNPLNELVNNYHLHVHEPFISRRPDDILYPIVLRREKSSLEKKSAIPSEYIDFSLLYLSKRLLELERYQNTPVLNREFVEPNLSEIHRWKDYYSWESNLSRYENEAKTLISWIRSTEVPEQTKNSMNIKLNETLSQHQIRLKSIIRDSKLDDKQKKYVTQLGRAMFERLFKEHDLVILQNTRVPFTLSVPKESAGKYTPYLKLFKEFNNLSRFNLQIDNDIVASIDSLNKLLIPFPEVTIKKPESNIILSYIPQNLINENNWIGSGDIQKYQDQIILQINSQLGKNSGLSNKISDYTKSVQYIITFEYYIEGDDVIFRISEDQFENKKLQKVSHLEKLLTSKTWDKHQAIFTSHPQALNAFLQFVTEEDTYNGKVHLRNVSVTSVPDANVIFSKTNDSIYERNLPTITFRKINPTRYSVNVTNATNPYALVFSESFSNNWKLYLKESDSRVLPIVASYFGNQVNEHQHVNAFFDFSFLQKGEQISAAHTVGNGYANLWNIIPENVGNKKTYSLDIVYEPQVRFYYFLSISLVTIGIVMILLIYTLVKRK